MPHVIAPEVMKSASDAVNEGIDTVTTTWLLYRILVELPKIANDKARKIVVDATRQTVGAKNVKIGADTEERLKNMVDPSEPATTDS